MSIVLDNALAERRQRIEAVGFSYAGQAKTHLEECSLCGNSQFVVLTHRDRYHFPTKTMACLGCGLVFLNPVMTSDAYKAFYAQYYRSLLSAFRGCVMDLNAVHAKQRVYAEHLADLMWPFVSIKSNRTLLEIEGSSGIIAQYLFDRFGFQQTILDPVPMESEQARMLGMKTIAGLLEDFEADGQKYDCILLSQSANHLLDMAASLKKIKQLLSWTGYFYIDILDFRAAYLRAGSIEEAIRIDHPYYYTEPTIESYLARAGFAVIRKNYIPDSSHIGYLCKHAEPKPNHLPTEESVTHLLREIREIQIRSSRARG
jgi:hypothetical protein